MAGKGSLKKRWGKLKEFKGWKNYNSKRGGKITQILKEAGKLHKFKKKGEIIQI